MPTFALLLLAGCADEPQPTDLYEDCVAWYTQTNLCIGNTLEVSTYEAELQCEDLMYETCDP